jgi:hypothetical protein
MSTNPRFHVNCFTDDCDCTCAGCSPKECKTCPSCGAEIDGTPVDGGVTDPVDSPSYRTITLPPEIIDRIAAGRVTGHSISTWTGPAHIGSWIEGK